MPDPTLDAGMPAAVDAERVILGAILLDPAAFTEASEKLEADDLFLDSHRRIFHRMSELVAKQHTVDIVTLGQELTRHKEIQAVGGMAYLASLTEGLPMRPVISEYVHIVKDKALLRRLMLISSAAIQRAADQSESAVDVLGAVAEQIQQASEQAVVSPLQTFGAFVAQGYQTVDDVFRHSAKSLGLPSGLTELDELTCGFQRKELIIVAARPGLGKTAVGLCFAGHAAIELDRTVSIFSLEMRKEAILHRLVAMYGTLNLQNIREGRWTEVTRRYAIEAMSQIVSAPLYIDDQQRQSVQKIKAKAARLKAQTGHLDLVVIDQLNYIEIPGDARRYGNRSQDLGHVTRALKTMAYDLDVPVILLHQLNRSNEKREDKEPWLSELKDSGSVEEDADLVLFPHRPAYYSKTADEKERKKAVIIVAKQRQGPVGRANVEYIGEQTLFRNVTEDAKLWGRD